MAIYIQLVKREEDASGAIYDFGPAEGIIGSVFIGRGDRKVSLIQIEDSRREAFYLTRVGRALRDVRGEFPTALTYTA